MKHLIRFNEHYRFNFIDNGYSKTYEFTTKNNIEIVVKFCNLGLIDDEKYTREYYNKNGRKYAELKDGDSFSILDTVTKITIQFIKDFSPNRIEIDHIPTARERENTKFVMDYLSNSVVTKRAIINKRYLERELPESYSYKLVNSKSIITKNPS